MRWDPSASGIAQIEMLQTRRVRLVYRSRHGKIRHVTVPAVALRNTGLLFDMNNPYGRGLIAKSRRFTVEG